MTQELLMMEIQAMEVLLLKKKKRLVELSKKYSKRSLSQMFPSESGAQPFTIDNRQEVI
jgi:hypothetical protein